MAHLYHPLATPLTTNIYACLCVQWCVDDRRAFQWLNCSDTEPTTTLKTSTLSDAVVARPISPSSSTPIRFQQQRITTQDRHTTTAHVALTCLAGIRDVPLAWVSALHVLKGNIWVFCIGLGIEAILAPKFYDGSCWTIPVVLINWNTEDNTSCLLISSYQSLKTLLFSQY